jgi:glycosyltransferase involved in cell wall biosynthesis
LLGRRQKRALFSYLADPLSWRRRDARLHGHSNKWESREIARLLARRGYRITAIDWSDKMTVPPGPFDCVLDIHSNLPRLAARFPDARRLLHLTGSFNQFQHQAESARIKAFEARRGITYPPQRHVADLDSYEESLRIADVCSLIGNDWTASTYPISLREKIRNVTVSVSQPIPVKKPQNHVPPERQFLWFGGGGCVLKGLDLVIEAFARNSELVLHIVGDIESEPRFLEAYRRELGLPNLFRHGYLDPAGPQFRDVVDRCVAFIAPSASEGISPAAASCMFIGLYPVVSRNTGVTLPGGAGAYLETCTIEEIETSALTLKEMSTEDLRESIALTQAEAMRRYSRDAFTAKMSDYLDGALGRVANAV